jgi:hypothetical protein
MNMILFSCDKEENNDNNKIDNDEKTVVRIVYEKDVTDTSINGYIDQFNTYSYIEDEDALALTYSTTEFEINFQETKFHTGININWPYQSHKQYRISFVMRSDIVFPLSVITSDTHLEDFIIETDYKAFVTYMYSSDFTQNDPEDIVVNIFFGMTNQEQPENTVYIKSIIVEEISD